MQALFVMTRKMKSMKEHQSDQSATSVAIAIAKAPLTQQHDGYQLFLVSSLVACLYRRNSP